MIVSSLYLTVLPSGKLKIANFLLVPIIIPLNFKFFKDIEFSDEVDPSKPKPSPDKLPDPVPPRKGFTAGSSSSINSSLSSAKT